MANPRLRTLTGADTPDPRDDARPDLQRDLVAVLRTLPLDPRDTWRREDAMKGKLVLARHLDAVIRSAHRARRPLDDVLRLAAAIEGFTLDVYASETATLGWVAAFRLEQQVNGETDLAQHDVHAAAAETRGLGRVGFASALRRAEQAFARQEQVSRICALAVRRARVAGGVA